ncbi:hypothetical protein [Ferruginibacter sp. HRS2-29]|uniref:hypothetical protein n=1 Tax=Ferruginibacter sp. HRS2-29 TaxID=2487334 RepID=UPI0020CEA259|nr:hypothetical protein [Ferruginibacter sp. HRS2-29]MCP9749493.1 haloacid dehalogenase-like hydrolase [Ferruginibacter sp. HRS2-29]
MGRPFASEIQKLEDTFSWAMTQDISNLHFELFENLATPLFIVGSGGSLSACSYLASLYQQQGMMAKAITPMELFYSRDAIRNSNVMFISASGRNTDILFSYKIASESEPSKLFSLCMKLNSPLSKLASTISTSRHFEFHLPSGKDGFLATNSLMAFYAILYKTFNLGNSFTADILREDEIFNNAISEFFKQVNHEYTFVVLYGGWGHSIAVDLESKLAEAGLANILFSDYRNFGHGRHNWFDKRNNNSAIIALVTPQEKDLAIKTIDLLPNGIPRLLISSELDNSLSSIELLRKAFLFINKLGDQQGIDPGRPGVPAYGSKLYHLNYKKIYGVTKHVFSKNKEVAILRKSGFSSLKNFRTEELNYWSKYYDSFVKRLTSIEYGAIIFDYDGTLCSAKERFTGVNKKIGEYLNTLLSWGIIIGIATGRGKSVREDLEKIVQKKYWDQVLIGYYNCSDIGNLSQIEIPNKNIKPDITLKRIFNRLIEEEFLYPITPELKPHQITIEICDKENWQKVRQSVIDFIISLNEQNIQVLESSHSMDVINQKNTNKLNIIKECTTLVNESKLARNILCIGDKGRWPGNDHQLLSTPHSLSVDEVSASKDSCWNLAEPSVKNILATQYYLSLMKKSSEGFRFNYYEINSRGKVTN